MRLSQLLFPLLAWVSFAPTLAQDMGLISAIEQLPPCALSCLTTAIVHSPCDLTDSTCICADAKLQKNVEGCVRQSCTLRQALITKNITASACNTPIRDQGNAIRTSNIALTVVTNIIVLSRLLYKACFSISDLGWDDYTVLTSLIIGVPSVVIIDKGIVPSGLGRDVWTLDLNQITSFVRWLYALEILYFVQLAVVKLSLLFFYLRIFPKLIIKRLLWATIAFNVLWGTTFAIIAVFQCQPISSYWNREKPGKCIDVNALGWSNAIISIALDLWMLALPLSEVFRLQLTWRKKASVALMFGVGTFVTVVSIVRLQSLLAFAVSTNPTWDQTQVVNWSNIEVNFGLICASLPTWRVMLVRFFPKIFDTSQNIGRPYSASGIFSQGKERGGTGLASGIGRNTGGKDPHTITYTKTFDIEHTENDETSLVQMNDLEPKKEPKAHSSSTSMSTL